MASTSRSLSRLFTRVPLSSSFRSSSRRVFSTAPPPPPNGAQSSADARSRLQQLNARLPAFLRRYTTPLLGAPVTHITSFLILHEITAVVPLFALVAGFHYGGWMPDLTGDGGAFDDGVKRFGRWLKKKGWVEGDDVEAAATAAATSADGHGRQELAASTEKHKGVRLVLEFATAYAITKALLPIRITASVWATPWQRGATRLQKQ
ncbi:hypothetical protein T310_6397 [Rasamsonia emersonii CBS 393.64]|uniref:Uncharacterized protein n=1 Tax=Rasamsonia emersonii (strain ATCC 16479 / CBS 393.64 / IMI 116815) TaxID=1408163 RepID=A0A0F4YMY9_RASE3|nr:hypothetical protein T310_6397 [Rasamsonia emersonii CBS 393.64]KKA19614.1 hypothetical protein T310_6397 [Rasamsonia emersonii CBS 393.64]